MNARVLKDNSGEMLLRGERSVGVVTGLWWAWMVRKKERNDGMDDGTFDLRYYGPTQAEVGMVWGGDCMTNVELGEFHHEGSSQVEASPILQIYTIHMSTFVKSIRLTKFSSPARYIPHTTKWRAPPSISHLSKMNSTSSAFQTSFEEGGNTDGPKQQSQLRNIKLNDGNEIPVVYSIFKFPSHERRVSNSRLAGVRAGYSKIQGRSKCSHW